MLFQLPGRCLLLLLASLLAGGCQRASYSFQPVASAPATVAAVSTDTLRAAVVVPASAGPPPATAASGAWPRRQLARRAVAAAASRLLRKARPLPAAAYPRVCRPGKVSTTAAVADFPRYGTRSRGLALLLAGIPLLLGLPIGLHDFYLGYPGRGIAKLLLLAAALVLISLGAASFFVGLLFGGAGSGAALLVLGSILYVGVLIWQLTDFILILTNGLLPRNGDYYPQPFQLRPEAEAPAR